MAVVRPEWIRASSYAILCGWWIAGCGGDPSSLVDMRDAMLPVGDAASGDPQACGNGHLEASEVCDGTQLGEHSCGSATRGALPAGTLACHANCTLDMAGCTDTASSGGTGGSAGATSGGDGGSGGVAGASGASGAGGTGGNGTGGAAGSGGTSGSAGTGGVGGTGGSGSPCGNSGIDSGEMCDGANLAGQTCSTATSGALPAGVLSCSGDCTLDTSACFHPCGNGSIDSGEMCDGANLAGQTCSTATSGALPSGAPSCNGNCTLDTSACFHPCGNGSIDSGEMCDGANLNGETCASATVGAMPNGTVACTSACILDVSLCTGDAGTGGAGGVGGDGGGGTGGGAGGPPIPEPPATCPTLQTGTIQVLGQNVQLWVGAKQANKYGPVFFYWHGTGSNSAEAVGGLGAALQEITDAGGLVASFTTSTATGQNTGNNVWYTGDFAMADIILACAVQQLNIDTRRIYTGGCSAGGLQSGAMVYRRSSYLAGAMPNSGGSLVSTFEDPAHIPAVITAHGAMGSDVVVIDFATTSINFCANVVNAGGFAVDCNHGGGHCASSTQLKAVQWEFLKAHPFGVTPEPYASGLPASFPAYCTIQ